MFSQKEKEERSFADYGKNDLQCSIFDLTFLGNGKYRQRSREVQYSRGKTTGDDTEMAQQPRKASKTCFNCGRQGHLSQFCPLEQRQPRCVECDKVGGHYLRCSFNKKQPSSIVVPRLSTPVIEVSVAGAVAVRYVETGTSLPLDERGVERHPIRVVFQRPFIRFYGHLTEPIAFELDILKNVPKVLVIWKPFHLVVGSDIVVNEDKVVYKWSTETMKPTFAISIMGERKSTAALLYGEGHYQLSGWQDTVVVLPEAKREYMVKQEEDAGIQRNKVTEHKGKNEQDWESFTITNRPK